MGETRRCEQCGRGFTPRREHARFCSGQCRVAWNHEKLGDEGGDLSALQWSVTALAEQAARLSEVPAGDRDAAAAAIGELVWSVTIVDATLVRYYPDVYDAVLAALPAGDREAVEGTMAGLRFVRNQMRGADDPGGFFGAAAGHGTGTGGAQAAAWCWDPVPEPAVAGLPSRSQEWELERYRAYQGFLAGHATGETVGRAAEFLSAAAAAAAAETAVGQPAG
jgi:hypothetical protein